MHSKKEKRKKNAQASGFSYRSFFDLFKVSKITTKFFTCSKSAKILRRSHPRSSHPKRMTYDLFKVSKMTNDLFKISKMTNFTCDLFKVSKMTNFTYDLFKGGKITKTKILRSSNPRSSIYALLLCNKPKYVFNHN